MPSNLTRGCLKSWRSRRGSAACGCALLGVGGPDPRRPYPTDLTDAEWALLEPLVPAPKSGGRPVLHARREIVDAISYWLRAGCAWRLLPHDFPPLADGLPLLAAMEDRRLVGGGPSRAARAGTRRSGA
ncbi:transposase [Planomonospora corallina]|uniref:Transposase n=1 Tax=Planomonospora corallina TaxID=1806052 RepID=A0ABV8I899_9ACTN